jgi:hypothetical protein
MKFFAIIFFTVLGAAFATSPSNTFTSGTTISAAQVNQNFSELYSRMPLKLLNIKINTNLTVTASETTLPGANILNLYTDSGLAYSDPTWTVGASAAGLHRISYLIKQTGSATGNLLLYKNGSLHETYFIYNATNTGSLLIDFVDTDTFEFRFNDGTGFTVQAGSYIIIEKLN